MDDLRSDMSAIHRIDDIDRMPAPQFFAYAYRLGAYQSVIAQVARQQRQNRPKAATFSIEQWIAAHPEAMEQAAREQKERKEVAEDGLQDS